MRWHISKPETHIVLSADHDTGAIDLRVFLAASRNVEPEVVGTASLRMRDLRDVVEILNERLQFQDALDATKAARRGTKTRRAIA